MLTSVTCQVELIRFRLVLMSIGSWFHGTGLFASCVQLFTRYRWSQIAKVEGSNGRGGGNKSCASNCGKDPKGGQVVSE